VFFCLEDLNTLLKKVIAWKQDLSLIVGRVREVIALFDDCEDGVDCNPVSSASEGFGDVMTETEAELLSARGA
jgi:hypothetical protein